MVVQFEKDPNYLMVFVPERRHTDTLMARPDPKKLHRKMYKNGRFQRVRRPTGLEVYNDAAKILEELLEKRIDRDVKVARQRRNPTHPTKEMGSVCIDDDDDVPVARCKTMPSRYRQGFDDDINKRIQEDDEKRDQRKRKKNGVIAGDGMDSSGHDAREDSDPEDENVTKNRKKKSLFKRAKENLIRTFQRDQNDSVLKENSVEKDSPVKKRKHKRRSSSIVSESTRNVKGHLNEDKSIDITEVVDYRHSNRSSKSESLSHKQRLGSISRSSLIEAIRNPFKKSSKAKENLDDDEKSKLYMEKGVRALSIDDDGSVTLFPSSQPQPSPDRGQLRTTRSVTPPPQPPSSISIHGGKRADSSSISPSSPYHRSSPSSERPQSSGVNKGGTLSSTTSTHYPTSEYDNSVGSLNFLPSDNILDCPGDDIEFIDDEFDMDRFNKDKSKSSFKYHGSEGLLNLKWLADQTANAKAFDFEIDEHSVSTRCPDGQVEKVTTVTATRTVLLPEVQEETEDEFDGNVKEKPDMMKDEIYGKIAQKLIEMADTYSASMSDAENRVEGAAASISDAPLTDLEKEIIACLRSGGDKYGKKMEDQLDAIKSAVTEDAYARFRSTVDNSMGHELSWNTVALLFYATKGVVSAVGKSSQVATQAKEFTLKYISDTFVSWIMEQGGFDSMLSGSESDPELD